MSEVVGIVGMSHSPFATMTPPGGPAEPGARFVADVELAQSGDDRCQRGHGRVSIDGKKTWNFQAFCMPDYWDLGWRDGWMDGVKGVLR